LASGQALLQSPELGVAQMVTKAPQRVR
jgi:hypothetical protein